MSARTSFWKTSISVSNTNRLMTMSVRRGIDTLVEWFFERFEDPAHRLPYETAEGGFQWIYGGPYDAREQLEENFPDEAEHIIDAAVDRIESDGLMDWAPVAKPEDYEDPEDEEAYDEEDLNEIVRELDNLISGIPEPTSDPVFRLGDDGLVHMAEAPDRHPEVSDGDLFEELRSVSAALCSSLEGTNAHTDLLRRGRELRGGAPRRPRIYISTVWGVVCGLRMWRDLPVAASKRRTFRISRPRRRQIWTPYSNCMRPTSCRGKTAGVSSKARPNIGVLRMKPQL